MNDKNNTIEVIEKVCPIVKNELKELSKFSRTAAWCSAYHLSPGLELKEPDSSQLAEFIKKSDHLVASVRKIVPGRFEVSLHNAFFHFDQQEVWRGLSPGPGYLHIVLKSKDKDEYCFSYSGYVWHNKRLIGRILKSGKIKYGKISYGGVFLFNESIDHIKKEREEEKAKKESKKKRTKPKSTSGKAD